MKAIDLAGLEAAHGQTDYSGLRILAIDEIAVKKGHRYMTVVLDYMSGRVVWVGEGRRAETLDAFFGGMTDVQKAGIEAVAMDMWEPYINRVKAHCPQAKIVFDLFHLVKAFRRGDRRGSAFGIYGGDESRERGVQRQPLPAAEKRRKPVGQTARSSGGTA